MVHDEKCPGDEYANLTVKDVVATTATDFTAGTITSGMYLDIYSGASVTVEEAFEEPRMPWRERAKDWAVRFLAQ